MKNKKIINYFLNAGIRPDYKGFWCLHDAVQMVIDNNKVLPSLTTYLYPTIAEKYNITWKMVERNIRYLKNNCNNENFKNMPNKKLILYLAIRIMMLD